MVVVLIISVILNMALPTFITARNNTQTKACITNLRHIQDAKDEWSIVARQPLTATPAWTDLAPYIQLNGQTQLTCPTKGGVYVINDVQDVPLCHDYGGTQLNPGPHSYDGN
jgi:competence protein ComGC